MISAEHESQPPEPLTPITFTPLNDQVLIKMDVQEISFLERGIDERPTVLPSGVVVGVGRGVFVPGTGFVANQISVGDHVALSMDGAWTNLPISEDKNEIYVCVSESLILGKLEGLTRKHRWFQKQEAAAAGDASRVLKMPRR